uniref:Acidic pathogenesis-related (PR) class 1 gene (OsPR1a)-like protein n=1 Tax=Oryza sativa subsp. japonica TaxID=39947 RepID=Q6ZKH1_ORYSJ|nr:rice acidic pathogenesis-related (PR) class 1 gene (OsPR1a)-like protein [Oryza sativa Japonica Group]
MPARSAGGGAPTPRWSPPATTGSAERRSREGREGGKEATVHGSPRGDGGDGGGCGAARVDEDDGAPAVGDRNREVDEVGEDAAKPKEAAPRWEAVRGDDGGGPELGGDGGERERCRELESGEDEGRREAETDGGGAGRV